MMGSLEYMAFKKREQEWDAICALYGTDLYGLLDRILEDPDYIGNIKTILKVTSRLHEAEKEK